MLREITVTFEDVEKEILPEILKVFGDYCERLCCPIKDRDNKRKCRKLCRERITRLIFIEKREEFLAALRRATEIG